MRLEFLFTWMRVSHRKLTIRWAFHRKKELKSYHCISGPFVLFTIFPILLEVSFFIVTVLILKQTSICHLWMWMGKFWIMFYLIVHSLKNCMWRVLRVIFKDPSEGKKAQQQGQQRVGRQVAKPLGSSSGNDGSQVHEINKWVLRR